MAALVSSFTKELDMDDLIFSHEIGRGAFSNVWEAKVAQNGTVVAAKVIRKNRQAAL